MRMWNVAALLLCAFITTANTLGNYIFYNNIILPFQSHTKRHWFHVEFDFRNFYQILKFCDPLSKKNPFLCPNGRKKSHCMLVRRAAWSQLCLGVKFGRNFHTAHFNGRKCSYRPLQRAKCSYRPGLDCPRLTTHSHATRLFPIFCNILHNKLDVWEWMEGLGILRDINNVFKEFGMRNYVLKYFGVKQNGKTVYLR